jgi:hypothetical protein
MVDTRALEASTSIPLWKQMQNTNNIFKSPHFPYFRTTMTVFRSIDGASRDTPCTLKRQTRVARTVRPGLVCITEVAWYYNINKQTVRTIFFGLRLPISAVTNNGVLLRGLPLLLAQCSCLVLLNSISRGCCDA